MKAVVVYYSLDGNTELIADMVSKKVGADKIKLQPEKEIAKEGFKKFFWGGKSVIFKEKPVLLNRDLNLDSYDTVIIGTPIWAATFTPAILSFVSQVSLKGKKVHLYACSSGGDAGKCFTKLKELLKDSTIINTVSFKDPIKEEKQKVEQQVDKLCSAIKE
jgi:flavodoxin